MTVREYSDDLEHDDLGRLTAVYWVEAKKRSQIYRRAPKGEGSRCSCRSSASDLRRTRVRRCDG